METIDTPIEIVFSFDATGSMTPCLDQVRKHVENVLAPLFKEMPNLRIGLAATGDYIDLRYGGYTVKWQPLTNNLYDLTQFVRKVPNAGGGGDGGECYELMLKQARELNWSLNSKKILVLIGDDIPHVPGFRGSTENLNWRDETKKLTDLGISIYTVECLYQRYPTSWFYEELASRGGGYHLMLDQFTDIVNMILAIVHKQTSDERLIKFEEELYSTNRMNRALNTTISTLTGQPRDAKGRFISTKNAGLVPVQNGRFQILEVDHDADIKGFVENNNLPFKKGRGFYSLIRSELVQENKEVILQDKMTGDLFTGDYARNLIGVPTGTRGNAKPTAIVDYNVFIQSTSINRKLKAGTKFLYEVQI